MNYLIYFTSIFALVLCSCRPANNSQFQPWPPESIQQQSINKEVHIDRDLNAVMNAAVEAAKRSGFIFDGSQSKAGDISVNTRWGTDTVTLNLHYSKASDGTLSVEHDWKCNGITAHEQGDQYIINMFFSSWDSVMSERKMDPYNPKYN